MDHRHAMEARFPGSGHAMTVKFTAEATQRSRPDFLEKASDPPAQPPEVDKKAAKEKSDCRCCLLFKQSIYSLSCERTS